VEWKERLKKGAERKKAVEMKEDKAESNNNGRRKRGLREIGKNGRHLRIKGGQRRKEKRRNKIIKKGIKRKNKKGLKAQKTVRKLERRKEDSRKWKNCIGM
jgi:hypothetical protein